MWNLGVRGVNYGGYGGRGSRTSGALYESKWLRSILYGVRIKQARNRPYDTEDDEQCNKVQRLEIERKNVQSQDAHDESSPDPEV